MALIELKYSCSCGIDRVTVRVDERRPDEDVKVWMDRAVAAVTEDHRQRSPACQAETIDELMIPIPPGVERVGEVPRS